MADDRKGSFIIRRRADIAALETARLKTGMSIIALCAKARIDPSAYRHLLRYRGERSRDRVILRISRALGLSIEQWISFPPSEGAALCEYTGGESGAPTTQNSAIR